MIERIDQKRKELEQKRQDIEDTMREMDAAEESCIERLAELRVNQ